MERNVKLLALINFLVDLKFHSAILILYFVQVTGSFALGMSVFGAIQIFAALFEVPTGMYSDYIGRKKTLLLGALCAILAAILYAIGINYWILIGGAMAEGLSRAWYSGNNNALLYDSLNSLKRKSFFDHYFGRISSLGQIGLGIGALLGSVLASWSFAWVMWLSVIPQVTCFIVGLLLQEPHVQKNQSANIFSHLKVSAFLLWKNKTLRLVSLQDILGFGINEATFDFRAAFIATLWPTWAIGISKMISFWGATISYWYGNKVIQKLGSTKTILVARIFGRISNFIGLLFPTIASPIIIPSSSLLYGAMNIATTSIMQKEFTSGQRATMASINSLLGSMLFAIFSVSLGRLADMVGPRDALLAAEFLILPIVFISWKLYKLKTK